MLTEHELYAFIGLISLCSLTMILIMTGAGKKVFDYLTK